MSIQESECWEDKYGGCCCKCALQTKIFGHPWNQPPHKGSISTVVGFGCMASLGDPDAGKYEGVVFFDREHGMCEMFTPKDEAKMCLIWEDK